MNASDHTEYITLASRCPARCESPDRAFTADQSHRRPNRPAQGLSPKDRRAGTHWRIMPYVGEPVWLELKGGHEPSHSCPKHERVRSACGLFLCVQRRVLC